MNGEFCEYGPQLIGGNKRGDNQYSTVDSLSGFTLAEKRCHDALMQSYREFIDMPREHPDEMRDFVDAVHKIQGLLTTRIVRRVYPKYWPTRSDQPKESNETNTGND